MSSLPFVCPVCDQNVETPGEQPCPHCQASAEWRDLLGAVDFTRKRLAEWNQQGRLSAKEYQALASFYDRKHADLVVAARKGQTPGAGHDMPPRDRCWDCSQAVDPGSDYCKSCAAPIRSGKVKTLRYLRYLLDELRGHEENKRLSLEKCHDLRNDVSARLAFALKQLHKDRPPMAELVVKTAAPAQPGPAEPAEPRRSLLEILLDPRNIQMLLALGGALMVGGLVILLAINEFFTPRVVALGMSVANAAVLGAGWWVRQRTRYQMVGLAVTLLACLVMPLNLWYFHVNHLITLEGHLWLAAVVISAAYAASALVLRDELFVYIFAAGITLTGLLLLANLDNFWEIALPASMLVALGLLAIHAERAFPEQEGPFGRRRFGMAFFWSGQVLLASGLLLVLGAQVAGDWFYEPLFQRWFPQFTPSPIVASDRHSGGELGWLGLALVLAGTYAYIYSDLVVRHVGVYVHIAAGTLMWALVLALEVFKVALGMDTLIIVLALTGLAVNGAQATAFKDSRYTKSLPVLGILLPLLAVALGLLQYCWALSPDLKSVWHRPGVGAPAWSYVGAMVLTALSCRLGAYLYLVSQPRLAAAYFFATGAAVLVAATAALAALGLHTWPEHAPLLMVIPIAYVLAAHLYRGRPEEQPLLKVSHAAAAVMIVSSLASAVEGFKPSLGFTLVEASYRNLVLALFCAEGVLFYSLATVFYRQAWTIHLATGMACGALWQLLIYLGVSAEYYTLTFALVGLALVVAYRFAVLERFAAQQLADGTFQSGNALLSLAFVAAWFMGLSKLLTGGFADPSNISWALVRLFVGLTIISLLALALVRHAAWRRWYVITTISLGALTFLDVSILSELTRWQKGEIFCVVVGLILLTVGHIGWYREREQHNDMVSLTLLLGSLLVGVPLALATIIDRRREHITQVDHFIVLNELGFLAAGLALLTTGFLFQLKSTTLTGAALMILNFLTLLIFVPWTRLSAVAIFIMVGGGLLFGAGLVLSVFRERLLVLPEKIKRREGLFRVLNWR